MVAARFVICSDTVTRHVFLAPWRREKHGCTSLLVSEQTRNRTALLGRVEKDGNKNNTQIGVWVEGALAAVGRQRLRSMLILLAKRQTLQIDAVQEDEAFPLLLGRLHFHESCVSLTHALKRSVRDHPFRIFHRLQDVCSELLFCHRLELSDEPAEAFVAVLLYVHIESLFQVGISMVLDDVNDIVVDRVELTPTLRIGAFVQGSAFLRNVLGWTNLIKLYNKADKYAIYHE